ncbi:MAG: DUF4212 domain-containing protein [Hyphomicrobiaceae bacterium]
MRHRPHRRPYWRETKRLAVFSLCSAAVAIALPVVATRMASGSLLGLPIGYLAATLGCIAICLLTVARFSVRQDEIDQWHGAQEDI